MPLLIDLSPFLNTCLNTKTAWLDIAVMGWFALFGALHTTSLVTCPQPSNNGSIYINVKFIARAEKGKKKRNKQKTQNQKPHTYNFTSSILPLQLQPLANIQTASSRKKKLHYFNEKYNSEQMQLSPDKSLGRHSYFSLRA